MKQLLNSNIDLNWPNIEIEFERPVKLFIDSLQGFNQNDNSFKIFYLKEAEGISKLKDYTIKNSHLFDAIITFEDDVLNSCKNSYFLPFGTTWVHNYVFSPKVFSISNLTGHKEMTEGHRLRKKVHYNQEKIGNPKDFYISKFGGVENFANNKILQDKKEPMFDSQFHICIENSKQKNYFTEKLIDCFVTKTIPIYYGCPNIQDFFDVNGMFIVNSLADIIVYSNALNQDTYNSKLEYVEKNYVLSQQYTNLPENIRQLLLKILK